MMASLDAKKEEEEASVDRGSEKKARRIVSWSDQEDALLREQIGVHGTDNWTVIASMFEDKTTRQCRRRWYTYLNSDFKKGGWSPQEDMLLCEAQKNFGNRWTEIAKVVPGRTDNAVKNRFTTLCKKRAKSEALPKETTSYINQNNKRVLIAAGSSTHETSKTAASLKRLREFHVPTLPENCNDVGKLLMKCEKTMLQQLRPPFSVLAQNFHNVGDLIGQHHPNNVKEPSNDVQDNKIRGIFLKRDDPTVTELAQQAELLGSLAVKVNTESTDQSLENSWKFLQDFLSQNKENDMLEFTFSTMDLQLGIPKESVDDTSSHEGSRPSWRQPPDLCEDSPGSSEYSTGSTLLTQTTGDRTDETQAELCGVNQDGVGLQSVTEEVQNDCEECRNGIDSTTTMNQEEILLFFDEPGNNDGIVSAISGTEFSSPLQVTPLFQSLAAGIPSPKFTESERHFLLKTLGLESPSANPSTTNPSQPPPCRRALLNSL